MVDSRGFTVLSLAAFKGLDEMVKILYHHGVNHNLGGSLGGDSEARAEWVNAPSDQGWTALHMACYNGNHAIIKFLVEVGQANYNLINRFGCSVLHIAA